MTYEQALRYIHSFPRFRSENGLLPVERMLAAVGNPHQKLSFVHVAGTNGKGSTVNYCASVLAEAGYRTGLFTSPFVSDFRERMQINGEMISQETLIELTKKLRPVVSELEAEGIRVREFEFVTVLALYWFWQEQCEIVCLEVGLGGLTDATNVIPAPLVAVITPISLDHTHILGHTVEQIATHKAGIIKPGSVCVCCPKQEIDAVAVLMQQCAKEQVDFVQPSLAGVTILRSDLKGNLFRYADEEYELSLVGEYQVENAVTALEVFHQLGQKGYRIPLQAIREGLRKVTLPARFERFSERPFVAVDGSHNPQATEELRKLIEKIPARKKVLLMAMSAEKDCGKNVQTLASAADIVYCVENPGMHGLAPEKMAEYAAGCCRETVIGEEPIPLCQEILMQLSEEDALIVCGSFYIAGEIRPFLIEKYGKTQHT